MGISDREYVRRDTRRGIGLGRSGPLSITTWIIVINIAVFVLDALLSHAGIPVLISNPQKVDLASARVERDFRLLNDDVATNAQRHQVGLTLYRSVFTANGQPAGHLVYEVFPPLQALGHFSTYSGFWPRMQVWRLITFQFLHASIMHIFFNMFGLWVFGGLVETHLGRKRYAAFYLVCGIFGGLAYLTLSVIEGVLHIQLPGGFENIHTPLIGASAGVFGVIVASAYIAPDSVVVLLFPPIPLKLKWFAYGYVALAAFAVITGAKTSGGDAAHLGGAFAGYFFIRNAHLLRDFFDIFSDSRKPPRPRSAERPRRSSPSRDEVDRILAKVGTEGLHSLSDAERRTLREATDLERRH
jgi:rhomboid family protein